MNPQSSRVRQPQRDVWPRDKLVRMRAYALAHALAPSTSSAYSSALNSYLSFCKNHGFDIEPTEDTLSFYAVYMSYHIKPSSVTSYLSGIQNQLEAYFPNIRKIRASSLVSKTLYGCRRLCGSEVKRKKPLEPTHIQLLTQTYASSNLHDDRLFLAQVTSGFSALNRLGELVWPDSIKLQSYGTIPLRHSVSWHKDAYGYVLPRSKTDRIFEGNHIIVQKNNTAIDPFAPFVRYLSSRDSRFPGNPELWLRADGSVPTRKWFLHYFHHHFPPSIGGQSIRSGGATALALAGVPNDRIQAAGRWSSDAFQAYIRKNPFLLQALIWGRPASQDIQGLPDS